MTYFFKLYEIFDINGLVLIKLSFDLIKKFNYIHSINF